MAEHRPPPIPASCAARPTTPDGLVVPFGNVVLADGGVDFRTHHNNRWLACWRNGWCQVCGRPIPAPIVFLCGPAQLAQLLFDEPPVHPECARYVGQACPMVAGERDRYRTGPPLADRHRGKTCSEPGCDCGGWIPTPGLTSSRNGADGAPAHDWYAVWARSFHLAAVADDTEPDGYRVTGGACLPGDVIRVRLVSRPGAPQQAWTNVPDWLDRYRPPELAPEEMRRA